MSSQSHENPAPRGMMLRIRRGKTGFPLRPIDAFPFLIGSAPQCQLKLGGDVPGVHSMIRVEGDVASIECLSPLPELKVNGTACSTAELPAGSAIEIGPFLLEFVVLPAASVAPSPMVVQPDDLEEAAVEAVPVADELVDDPQDLSVHGLVDRLEAALERLETMESRRRDGVASLLERMLEVAAESPARDGQRKSA